MRLENRFAADLASGKLPEEFAPKAMARLIVTLAGGLAVEAQSGAGRQDLYAVIDSLCRTSQNTDGIAGQASKTVPGGVSPGNVVQKAN